MKNGVFILFYMLFWWYCKSIPQLSQAESEQVDKYAWQMLDKSVFVLFVWKKKKYWDIFSLVH